MLHHCQGVTAGSLPRADPLPTTASSGSGLESRGRHCGSVTLMSARATDQLATESPVSPGPGPGDRHLESTQISLVSLIFV